MCNQFHRMESGVCNQFHTMEAGVGAHEAMHIVRTRDFWKYGIVYCLTLGISMCLTSAIRNVNLRTDALLNVTRIAGHEAVNTTLDEDLSNCTTSSLKDCALIHDGTWYIEAKNSFYGKLSNYSYFIDNGSIVSCKELRDGDVSEEYGLPCAYYVGLSISIGSLLSAALIAMLSGSERQKVTESICVGLLLSWVSFFCSLLQSSILVRDFSGNIVGRDIRWDTFPSLLHFHWLALVGWLSVFSQRHFLVAKKSGTAVSTCGHVWDVIVRWTPYCAYFPAFFLFNWLLSSVVHLFPHVIMPACDESCWLTQNTLLVSFTAPIAVFALFNCIGGVMLRCREQHLEDPRLKENFLIFSKMFYFILIVTCFIVLANEWKSLDTFRLLLPCIPLSEVAVCYAVTLYVCRDLSRN